MRQFLLVTVPRIVLGLLFLVSAVDGFWWMASGQHLIHPPVTEQGRVFETALQNSGFFWPLLKTVNLVGALSLLLNIALAFGLALIAPVMAVIVAFHLTINPVGIPVAIILVICGALLVLAYRERYAGMFR